MTERDDDEAPRLELALPDPERGPYGPAEARATADTVADALPAVATVLRGVADRLERSEQALARRTAEQAQQFTVLTELRTLADAATGVRRGLPGPAERRPGAHGAVAVLAERYAALQAAARQVADYLAKVGTPWAAEQADRLRAAAGWTCPTCGRTSFHPRDVETGYCRACGTFPEQR
jgi:ribosomal protein L37E